MPLPSPLRLLLAWLAGATLVLANDVRFSGTLPAADRAAAGLPTLSSDQIAILDALVRRDTATRGQTPAPKAAADAAPAEFSRRLSADETRNIGLPSLAPAQVAKLDALVERHQSALLARTLLAPPSFLAPSRREVTSERKTERNVHGTFSLSYGWGKGGYSEKTGAMSVTLDDPARNLSVTIGYAETHLKGAPAYLYRDPPFRSPEPLREP
jgi:hypothetical protein